MSNKNIAVIGSLISEFPSPPNLEDTFEDTYLVEGQPMSLDFEVIQEATNKAKKEKIITKIEKHTPTYTLTEKESKLIDSYVRDMEKHITKFASVGKDKFTYDCSKIDLSHYLELAKRFKAANPKFYVESHNGPRLIIIDWVGKNEC